MSANSDGAKSAAQPEPDTDQSDAFRYELGNCNRERILASFDRRDDYARKRFTPRAPEQSVRQLGKPADPALAGWQNFRHTTTDRDFEAEHQGRLHDGQLYRLNRQARGEVIRQPEPPVRRRQQVLDPILSNPGEAGPLDVARALRFKGDYKSSKPRAPRPNVAPAFSTTATPGREEPAGRGRNISPSTGNGRRGTRQAGSLNPHADIHESVGSVARRKASIVRGGKSSFLAHPDEHTGTCPANNLVQPVDMRRGRSEVPGRRQLSAASGMDRSSRSMSSSSVASSAMASSSSGAIFATNRRPPPIHGDRPALLASPEDFMAAVKASGLLSSKHAPKSKDRKDQGDKTKPEVPTSAPTVRGGLAASRFAG